MTTDHPCQLCGERHPARYQFDCMESGGAKVTCARCVAGLLAARDAEIARLQNHLTGAEKAYQLQLAGMESMSELMDGLKHENRELLQRIAEFEERGRL
jgi:hypothetical protein